MFDYPSVKVNSTISDNGGGSVRIPVIHLVIWGSIGGLVSGTTGISGGVLFVPALIIIGIPVHFAVATSLLTIIPSSLSGAATHAAFGHFSLSFFVLYGAGAGIGALAGAFIAPRIQAESYPEIF